MDTIRDLRTMWMYRASLWGLRLAPLIIVALLGTAFYPPLGYVVVGLVGLSMALIMPMNYYAKYELDMPYGQFIDYQIEDAVNLKVW
ncbi:MAG: hypothetical protein HOU81_13885 [Hamadaea sp.]|uniref:hypothetical protein n=1 Tax=Hamadaea sp. TaxID=2024425 RepID=UPI001812A2E9|nr:hypothetical protein [Hamadaea sp.]NUR71908.1 hypothetical protein [Hamadaea sp.]NUT17968.1 hypothetical protein [Hamadaea sp.]